jgi:pyruvate kinase
VAISGPDVTCEVEVGGTLSDRKGLNIPGASLSTPALTDKDKEDMAFAIGELQVDYVALSFVRKPEDVQEAQALARGTPVIAKIEKPEALDDLAGILEAADAIMVARGDLGVEMPAERVPLVQKQLIEAANALGVPVITATQMLDSMIRNPRPTRAEASDVANAIIDGTDAVMLSGETASGRFPVESVRMMARIAEAAEASGRHGDQHAAERLTGAPLNSVANAISAAACAIVANLSVRAIVAFTMSGSTAELVAHLRPIVPILAFTPSEPVYRRLSLVWGVTPILSDYVDRLDDLGGRVSQVLLTRGFAQPGDTVVMTGGHPIAAHGETNFVKVLRV